MNNIDLVKNLYESFSRGDVPAVLAVMASDISWREAEGNPYQPSGAPWVGPDAIVQNLFIKLASEWDGFSVYPKTYHASPESVVVQGRYGGKYKTTGQVVDAQFCHVWTVRGDKLAGFQQFTDTAQFQDVMAARRPAAARSA